MLPAQWADTLRLLRTGDTHVAEAREFGKDLWRKSLAHLKNTPVDRNACSCFAALVTGVAMHKPLQGRVNLILPPDGQTCFSNLVEAYTSFLGVGFVSMRASTLLGRFMASWSDKEVVPAELEAEYTLLTHCDNLVREEWPHFLTWLGRYTDKQAVILLSSAPLVVPRVTNKAGRILSLQSEGFFTFGPFTQG